MNKKLEDFNWHDKILHQILIDRSAPGIIDEVIIDLKDIDSFIRIVFKEVYWLSMDMNFGIVSEDSILRLVISENENDEDLISFYRKWGNYIKDFKFRKYLLELNSSGSILKLIAKETEIKYL
ncbi:hypothetical protein MHJ94_11975 [Chryseobacterium taklimakanense]|uniref:hypothetical protein n=1 Tax=Chryseobacterium taklimakanense TaxID=536441 RepID=UPI001EF62157|nr:hypothetical protein [Chryseobacterium taklimakanense]MCG7282006.1 hypothetical protein [Chryseobacterium taklimakanense]